MEKIDKSISRINESILIGLILIYSGLIFLSPFFVKPITTIIAVILFSVITLKHRYFMLFVAFLIPPLLGRPDERLYYAFQSLDIIGLWILVFGSIFMIIYIRESLSERIFVILFFLLLLQLLTTLLSNHFVVGIVEVISYMSVLVVFPLTYHFAGNVKGRLLIYKLLLFSAIIPLIYGIYQKVSGDYSVESIERAATLHEIEYDRHPIYSTFWYNHPFAKFLRAIAPLVFTGIIFNQKKRPFQVFFGFLLIIIILELVFSEARSQLIGFFITSIVIVYALGYFKMKILLKYGIYLIPLIIALIFMTGVAERFEDLFQPINLTSNSRENSFKMRLIIWGRGLSGIISSPIIGHGPGSFKEDVGIVSHNDYLGMWYNLGIFGTVLYTSIFVYTYRKLMKYRRNINFQNWIDQSIYYSTIGLTVAIGVESFVENIFGSNVMWTIYLALIACSFCIIRENKERAKVPLESISR